MLNIKSWQGLFLITVISLNGCNPNDEVSPKKMQDIMAFENSVSESTGKMGDYSGVLTANGWYEEEEIYYILGGIENVSELGENQLYIIGGDRVYQANVALFIPGEPGYSVHWNVNVVHTGPGKTLADILASPYVSIHYPEALFDDVADILDAQSAGLVVIDRPGVVVNCPVISEQGAEAPGNTPLSEDFPPFPDTF